MSVIVVTVALWLGAAPSFVARAGEHVVPLAQGEARVEPGGALRLPDARISLALSSVRRATGPACAAREQGRVAKGAALTVQRACGVVESWTRVDAGLEHEVVVTRRPAGTGALRVRLEVSAAWRRRDADGHVFQQAGAGVLARYGNAFVVRGAERLPVPVEHVEGGLELVVPAALVDAPGAFPLHLDPLLSMELALDLANQSTALDLSPEQEPAIAWTPERGGLALVVWVDGRRGGDDLYGALLDAQGRPTKVGLPLVTAPGAQRKPAVTWDPGAGTFVLAWEDDQGVAHVRVNLDGVPGAVPAQIPSASAPSLTFEADAGVLLAYGENRVTPVVVGLAPNFPSERLPGTGRTVLRTAVSARNGAHAVAVETETAASSAVRVFLEGALMLDTDAPQYLGAERRPTVLVGETADEVWVAWETAVDVSGSHLKSSMSVPLTPFTAAHTPALLQLPLGVTLGCIQGSSLLLRNEEAGPTTEFMSIAAGGQEVALAATGNGVMAAWTTGLFATDVWGGVFQGTPAVLSVAPAWQRDVRVSMLGDRGWALWREGGRRVRAAPLSLRGSPPDLAPGGPFDVTWLQATDGWVLAADVASGPNGIGFVATYSDRTIGGGAIMFLRIDQMAAPVVVGVPRAVVAATSMRVVGPRVAWDGTRFVIAWSDGASIFTTRFDLSGVEDGQTLSAQPGVLSLDLECFRGTCATTWATATQFGGGLIGQPQMTDPEALGRSALANDGELLCAAWPTATGFGYGCYDGTPTLTRQLTVPWMGPHSQVELSPGAPGVLSWSDPQGVWIARPGGEPPMLVGPGVSPAIASAQGLGTAVRGLVASTRFLEGEQSQRAFVRAFEWPDDAGVVDGGVDAGSDGGVDAGTDGGVADGGPGSVAFVTTGCAAAPGVAWLALGVWLLRRRCQNVQTPIPGRHPKGPLALQQSALLRHGSPLRLQ